MQTNSKIITGMSFGRGQILKDIFGTQIKVNVHSGIAAEPLSSRPEKRDMKRRLHGTINRFTDFGGSPLSCQRVSKNGIYLRIYLRLIQIGPLLTG